MPNMGVRMSIHRKKPITATIKPSCFIEPSFFRLLNKMFLVSYLKLCLQQLSNISNLYASGITYALFISSGSISENFHYSYSQAQSFFQTYLPFKDYFKIKLQFLLVYSSVYFSVIILCSSQREYQS